MIYLFALVLEMNRVKTQNRIKANLYIPTETE